jgi:acyl-coenzyme A thioesterase PaaI-like protein
MTERLVTAGAPTDALRDAAERAEAMVEAFGRHPPGRSYPEPTGSGGATEGDFAEWSPQFGRSNPIAPPLRTRVDVDTATVVADVRFGAAYEGPPGCVHGGALAAAFDEVLGLTQSIAGTVGMTATLSLRYRRPTPLHQPLRFAGWVVSSEGRKVVTKGRCFHGGRVTVEADALFIAVGASRYAELDAARMAADPAPD